MLTQKHKLGLWEAFQKVDRRILYALLIVATSVPFFFRKVVIPTECKPPSIDLYRELMAIPEGGTLFLESDWTNSTRGENAGQLEALLRVIHQRKLKFVLYSLVDPQAPRVARDVIARLNQEFIKQGEQPLQKWVDWIDLEYYPDASSFLIALMLDLRTAIQGETEIDPSGNIRDALESPVLKDIYKIEDVHMLVTITGSGIVRTLIERVGIPPKVNVAAMVTGVMGPETLNFHTAHQLVGAAVGLRGTVELETMMAHGLNWKNSDHPVQIQADGMDSIPPLKNSKTFSRGMNYYLSLHVALFLLVFAIFLGNISHYVLKRKQRGSFKGDHE